MTDPWNPTDEPDEADPEITSALRTMAPPAHGYGFWAMLDARLAAEEITQAPPVPPPPPPPATPATPPVPPTLPLAEVVPLSRRRPGRWLLAAAAALVAVAGIAAVTRSDGTDLETTPAAPTPTAETSPSSATTMAPEPTSPVPAPGTTRPGATPSTVPRSTTTTPANLTLSPAGLGPLRLGMTHQQAMATGAVGPYLTTVPGSCRPAGPAGSFRKSGFSVLFVEDRLVRFFVDRLSSLRTPQGVTNGSPSSMISSVPGTRTQAPDLFGSGTRLTVLSGGSGYEFTVEQGVVVGWSVGTKSGLDLDEGCA